MKPTLVACGKVTYCMLTSKCFLLKIFGCEEEFSFDSDYVRSVLSDSWEVNLQSQKEIVAIVHAAADEQNFVMVSWLFWCLLKLIPDQVLAFNRFTNITLDAANLS